MIRLSEAAAELERAARGGRRATRIDLCAADDDESDPFVELALEEAPQAPAQRLIVGIDGRHLARAVAALEPCEPVAVTLYGGAERPLSACLVAARSGEAARRLLAPRMLRDADGRPFWETLDETERSWLLVAVSAWSRRAGEPSWVSGVLAPPSRPRVRWSVHVSEGPGDASWASRPEVRVLASAATPVALSVLRGSVVSLWHDVVSEPWPQPDPLVPREPVTARPSSALPRRFDVVDSHGATPAQHPLDGWARDRLESSGARHAQLVVLEGRRVALARAYTNAEEGYPRADVRMPMRLGSLSKCLTAIAVNRALHRARLSVDTPLGALPGIAEEAGALASISPRDLLEHRAGFPPRLDLRHDTGSPVAEALLAARFGSGDGRASPEHLWRALASGQPPLGRPRHATVYSNDGYILLGELLRRLVGARSFLDALRGELPGLPSQILLGSGRSEALARGESPVHPTVPTWTAARFPAAQGTPGAPGLPGYDYDGTFIAAAAGLSMPLTLFADLVATHVAAPAHNVQGFDVASGSYVGERGWWSTKCKKDPSRPYRFVRLHHTGRLEGASSLLIHQAPSHEGDVGRSTTLVFAVNVLCEISYLRDGHEAIQALKTAPIT